MKKLISCTTLALLLAAGSAYAADDAAQPNAAQPNMMQPKAAPEMATKFFYLLQQHFYCGGVLISEYSPVMGYAAGPGALFIGYQPRHNSSEQRASR